MKRNYENLPYEFLFMINGNPIVGRNFSVKNFNQESLTSYEIKETLEDVVEIIKTHFKNKTYDYLYRYYNPYYDSVEGENTEENPTNYVKDIYENEDFFTFQIKHRPNPKEESRVVVEKIFSGNDYPPKVRYDVDIRKIIPKIIEYLQVGMSQKKYTKNYCGYDLKYDLNDIFINKPI